LNAILDTNVLVSGIFFSGPPRRILEAWNHRAFDLVLSPEILDEYRRVADELHSQYPSIEIGPVLTRVSSRPTYGTLSFLGHAMTRDTTAPNHGSRNLEEFFRAQQEAES
jgi:hypothetical protein